MNTEDSERRYAQIEGERDYYKRLASKRALHIDDQNARIAQLEADCAAHKAAEETQIALRQKADERDALAEHLQRITSLALDLDECEQGSEEMGEAWDTLNDALQSAPDTNLARRDAEQQKIGAASFKAEAHSASILPVRIHLEGVFSVWMSKYERGLL